MKRRLFHLVGTLMAAGLCAAPGQAQIQSAGSFTVVVIVCQYTNSPPPAFTPQQWETSLNTHVTPFYDLATQSRVHFQFVAAPHVCQLDYPYTGRTTAEPHNIPSAFNDAFVVDNEGTDAIVKAHERDPDLIDNNDHVLVVLNHLKRGITAWNMRVRYAPGKVKRFSVSVVPQFRRSDTAPASGPNIDDSDEMSLISHELGHQLGLVDLYREVDTVGKVKFGAGPEFTGAWCLMSTDMSQSFSGYSRFLTGWIPQQQIEQIFPPSVIADVDQIVHLLPANAAALGSAQRELVSVSTQLGEPVQRNPWGLAFPRWEYMLEARPAVLDLVGNTRPTALNNVNIVDGGLPGSYVPGVLISKIKPTVGPFPGIQPMLVMARDRSDATDKDKLSLAAYGPGTQFDDHHGLTVSVSSGPAQDGGFDVHVHWVKPHVPDVHADGAWLDSPSNGYGTYSSGAVQNRRPPAHGDSVFIPVVTDVQWTGLTPHVTVHKGTAAHHLSFRVKNQGRADALDVKGKVLLLQPQLLAGIDFTDPASLANLNPMAKYDMSFGNIASGSFADASVTVNPEGPFIAVLFLPPARGADGQVELNLADNVSVDAFLSFATGPGSPYKPFELKFPVTNFYQLDRHVRMMINDPPPSWNYKLGALRNPKHDFTYLHHRGSDQFRLFVQPPDPALVSPAELKTMQHGTIQVLALMQYGDSWVAVDSLPIEVHLVKNTKLTLSAKQSGTSALLQGLLLFQDGSASKPLKRMPVIITLTGSDGSKQNFLPDTAGYSATTTDTGFFQQQVHLRSNVKYVAIAQFDDSTEYKGSVSPYLKLMPK